MFRQKISAYLLSADISTRVSSIWRSLKIGSVRSSLITTAYYVGVRIACEFLDMFVRALSGSGSVRSSLITTSCVCMGVCVECAWYVSVSTCACVHYQYESWRGSARWSLNTTAHYVWASGRRRECARVDRPCASTRVSMRTSSERMPLLARPPSPQPVYAMHVFIFSAPHQQNTSAPAPASMCVQGYHLAHLCVGTTSIYTTCRRNTEAHTPAQP